MTGERGNPVEDEVRSIYVGPDERFLVAFVVGYAEDVDDLATLLDEFGGTHQDPMKAAAAAALELTRDGGALDTVWYVLDRKTGEARFFQQSEFDRDMEVEG